MIKTIQNVFFRLVFCTLLLCSFGKVTAQTTMLSHVIAEDPVNFANRNFEAGTLTVTISSLPSSPANVKITFPIGIEYVANSLQRTSGSATISHIASSSANAPVFNISGTAPITFTIKRKITKNALGGLLASGTIFKDKVVVTAGSATDQKESNTYALPIPNIVVQLSEPTHNNASGTSVKAFNLRNTGNGTVKDIYFSVKYPTGVTSNSLTYNGTTLTSVGTVIGIGKNAGATLYKVSNPNGFKLNDEITITEKYTVTGCQANRQIVYETYWGESTTVLYQARDAGRAINITTGTPNIVLDTDSNHTYFEWDGGFCANKLGTFTVQYINKGSGNATAYDLEMLITPYVSWRGFRTHKPTNFRIVAADGTEIPISSMTPNGNEVTERVISFKDLTALTDAALGTKDIGLKDIDGDGFRDDLPINSKLKVRFDMVPNQSIVCLQNDGGIFSISPHSKFNYNDACGTQRVSAVHPLTNYTFRRLISGVANTSKIPASLSQNESTFGYISVGSHTIIAQQKTKGSGGAVSNPTKWRYEINLPAGVELKNVKFYEGLGFGQSTKAPTALPNVPAGSTFYYTATVRGYITFDMLLTTPCNSGNVSLQYKIYYLDKIGNTNTYCELPLICANTEITTICPGTCAGNGPVMISTKAERADNSYGWTDYTMNTRQTRANVSPIDRSRTLYLDDVEIISQGQQNGVLTKNLFYHAQVKSHAQLIPKSIAIAVGSNATVTLQASSATVLASGTSTDTKYFRWNLSSALPTSGIAAGEKFTVVATYQVNNANSVNDRSDQSKNYDIQVGDKSFFYMLDNANDTNINVQGYHVNEKHCGAKQTPVFYIAETYKLIGTNGYDIEACEVTAIGSQQVYLARRFNTAGTYYTNEFRPSHRIKNLKIIIPSSYNLVKPVDYSYIRAAGDWIENDVEILIDKFTLTDDGTYKTYTYINPPKGSPGYLNPGTVSVENAYGETIRTWLQATCSSKVFLNTNQAKTDNQMAKVNIDFEDFYYHYADKPTIPVQNEAYEQWLIYTKKPAINLLTQTPQNVTANKKVQTVDFRITNTSVSDAPYGWISIPDVTGVKVLSLVELNNSGSAVRTFTAQNISGEKMYFLSEAGNDGKIEKNTVRSYRLEYQITNCNTANLSFDVYAGWNCNGNPTQGYTKTCYDQKITYNVKIAKSLKQIKPNPANPGENNPDKIGTISMCQKTKYEYTINSGDEGDLFDMKLVVIQEPGLTISDVEVEYPLDSGIKYTQTSTPAISFSKVGNKITYDITAILPNGTLPGSISQPSDVKKRNLRLSFNVQPDCEFTAGSSFDIDVEGNNLCGDPAEGDKTKVIIAGIAGVDTNKYKVNNSIVAQGGNANACASSYAVFKGKHEIVDLSPSHNFQTGDNGLVVIRIPKGFEYVTGSFSHTHNSATYFAAPTLPTPPTKQIGNDETELSIRIPSGMKGNDYFEYTIQIRQKANTPIIDCGETKKMQYYTTDKVDGIACPSGPSNPCPSIAVETTIRRGEVEIPLERPDLSIKNVTLSSVAQNNKEKVSIQYILENASTATMTYSGDLKVSLYSDTNNNGIIEEGTDAKVQDFTISGLTLAPGATTTRTETLLLDQSQLCRLYLSIRNTFNPCLCNDKVVKANAPTTIDGLVATVTACEIGKTEITYNSQAPEYESYTWEAVTTGALAHLSATNIKNPIFEYTGTNITAIQTITYLLKVKRTNACEATQTVTVVVTPAPNAPIVAPQQFCAPATVLDLKLRVNSMATNSVKVYSGGTVLSDTTTLQSGTYKVSLVQSSGCETEKADVTVSVTICNVVAKDDLYKVFAPITTATVTGNILNNDKVGGVTATTATVDISNISSAGAGTVPVVKSNGDVEVPANTPIGQYQITYKICAKGSSVDCATATVTVIVAPKLEAKDDDLGTLGGLVGGTTTKSVFENDLKGTTPINPSDVNLTWGTPPSGITTNNDGTLTVAPNTPAGTYTVSYTICEKANPTNCSTATATVKVITLDAVNDGTKVLPKTGGNITVLNNDIYGAPIGVTSVTTANVSLTITYNSGISGLTVNSDGTLNVPASTPAGTYNNVEYRICTLTTPVVCDTATLTIVKQPEIIANDDVFSGVVSTTNITVGNVLNNPPSGSDTLNGNQATTANVAIAVVTPAVGTVVPYLTPATGNVVIPTGTPTGTYTITYRICEKGQTGTPTTNCDTATVTVNVTSPIVTPTPTVHAVPDTFTYSGTATQTVGNVLTNDTVSGTTSATTSNVTISQVSTPTGAIVPRIDTTNGDVIVPNNTPAGIYTITYQICTVATPTACATTTVQITVPAATPTPTIAPIAVDDRATTPLNTPIVVNVLANDTLNGATTPNVVANPANGTVIVNLDGSIEYRPNTGFTGTDTFVYELCNPQGNCDSATVTIEVVNTIIPYNGMSVDGDGKNDHFHIGGIESYPNNVVRIYNRWGVKVFETEGYDNVTRMFKGISNGRVTVNAPEKLPQGTYYYVIEYYDHNNNKESKVGWLYIKK
nr:gliding motility-associated C-terminal domain-containing protein [uncultured Capnocytophaga sp.]